VTTWLIKPGELTLKGENRRTFETVLRRNLTAMLGGIKSSIETKNGRFYLHTEEPADEKTEQALNCLIGIAGWARATTCPKSVNDVMQACIREARMVSAHGAKSFKIEARRTDKSFPLDSYALKVEGGNAVLRAVPGLCVDVHHPDSIITIEIREKGYIYSNSRRGLGGLPVGSGGRGLLLLSGGIDSPAAGFRMACRGMGIDAVHFHSYPYTSAEARQKVIDIARILSRYCLTMRLFIVGFTEVQKRIKKRSPEKWSTVLLRMAMMECAEKIAAETRAKCLITGESLSQVASQTIENLNCTESRITLPVLRPLIGDDKESIIRLAEKIGTYATSILPYEDCCVLFSPPHPVLRGNPVEAGALYEALDADCLLANALKDCEVIKISAV
jgi:thiamine biosynthesis protein ThiI